MRSASKRIIGVGVALATSTVAAPALCAAPPSLDFATVFATTKEPRRLHYKVMYRTGDGIHRVEIWRDGAVRLKRVTDGVVTTLIHHDPRAADFTMQVIDPRKHTSTRVDRASLYRIGNFTDWFDLAHGLRHPKGSYRLVARAPLSPMPKTPAACRWYDLKDANRTTSICWDSANAVPLLIASGPGHPIWRVETIDRAKFDGGLFQANDRGFIHDDATRDIQND
ncbi:hypothetical protein SFC76_09135 [Sphingomonas sp. CD22]|uniref:hypothetical protein n=1 Tax=Sphingomonas sp. CD22 TaxID=3100214 RepID=UPI002AE06F04|nr:hypothetical protein [Sphingomonas sp. CD22]MEA1084424.1 hypothetical protein [Sphingomonas sp. CD22]